MKEIASFKNQELKNNKEKINFINVNNYINPQINIIKVNKLSETKRGINNKDNKNKLINKKKNFVIGKNINKNLCIEKVKSIQLWWKSINKIIKIQKNIRGFIFRNKLLDDLEKEEKIYSNIAALYKSIRKLIIIFVINKINKYSLNLKLKNNYYLKYNLNKNKKILKTLNENDIKNKYNKEKIIIKNFMINYNNNGKINNNIYKNKKRQNNNIDNFKSLSNISFIDNKIRYKNKINEEFFQKIKYLKRNLRNKLLFNKKIQNTTNFKDFNNFDSSINCKYNNKNRNNITKNNKNSLKIKKNFKSRNLEPNKTYYSNFYRNLNKQTLTESNQIIYLTNKNSSQINNKKSNNNIVQTLESKKKTKSIFNCNNNIIIDNPISERNRTIKNNEFLLINKSLKKNNLKKTSRKKKDFTKIKNYYFSLWKEKTEKNNIIKYIINNYIYNNSKNTFINKKNINNIIKEEKIANIKYFKEILLKKGLGLLIKKILNKCTLYKYFILFNYYTEKINIFQKLKNHLKFKSTQKNLINRLVDIQNRDKKNFPANIPKVNKYKNKKTNNKKNNINKLSLSYSSLASINKIKILNTFNIDNNLNKSNKNLQFPKIKINRPIFNNFFNKTNKNKTDKILLNCNLAFDTILLKQIKQLKIIVNLIELKIKNKKTIKYYFNKWKDIINDKFASNNIFSNTYNQINTSKRKKKIYFSQLRGNSFKDKEIYSKKTCKSKTCYNFGIKMKLNMANINNINNDSINMIYRKKFFNFANKINRNEIGFQYSSLFELNKLNNNIKEENSCINLSLSNNLTNPINGKFYSTEDNFYKAIEEKEIFFNKRMNKINKYNILSDKKKIKYSSLTTNSYYIKKPFNKNSNSSGDIINNRKTMNSRNSRKLLKKIKKNYSFNCSKKGYYYDFFIRLLIPRKKTL